MASSRYLPLFELAEGGMGNLSLVVRRDQSFERVYAMKRVAASLASDLSVREMFKTEALIAGHLRHPNTVPVLDVGQDDVGPFLIMDYVPGVTLAEFIGEMDRRTLLPIETELALAIAQQCFAGLQAIHAACDDRGNHLGLIHRDLTPSNILVGYDGVVRAADFGIAKTEASEDQTANGVIKGKPGYLAPEQLRLQPLTQAADVYTLGVTIFELLTGERLFAGAKRGNQLSEDVPDLGEFRADAPAALVSLLFRILSSDPKERPTAAECDQAFGSLRDSATEVHLTGELNELFGERRAEERARLAESLSALSDSPSITRDTERTRTAVAVKKDTSGLAKWLWIAAAAVIAMGLIWVFSGRPAAPVEEPISEAQPSSAQVPVTPVLVAPTTTAPAILPGVPAVDETEPAVRERRLQPRERPSMASSPPPQPTDDSTQMGPRFQLRSWER